MSYFTREDHLALLSADVNDHYDESGGVQGIYRRLLSLHKSISSRLHKHGVELHPAYPKAVAGNSAAASSDDVVMSLAYMRPPSNARTIEGIMGRDELTTSGEIDPRRHPVIEIRLTPHAFTVELVVSPMARQDQKNFAGKLFVDEHRAALFEMLYDSDTEYVLGFWNGLNVDDMHINTGHLPPARVLHEWIGTFAAGRDYLRIGAWYDAGDERLNEHNIVNEVYQRVRELYQIYEFIGWTSNNDFIQFYQRTLAKVR